MFKKDFSNLKYKKKDIMTDMPYTIYAEGIYRAIKLVSSLGVPIIITENGVADASDNDREMEIKNDFRDVCDGKEGTGMNKESNS